MTSFMVVLCKSPYHTKTFLTSANIRINLNLRQSSIPIKTILSRDFGHNFFTMSKDHIFSLITPHTEYKPSLGGGERDRTDDLLRARQALSQLSYTPEG